MNKIKSNYIIRDIIVQYIPLKKMLLIFKGSRHYKKVLELYPSLYELYYNIQNDFQPYDENLENEMLSYITHFSRLQKHLSDKLLIEYYFRFLLTQKIILAEYDNIHFGPLFNYLNTNKYNGTLIVKLNEPKLDLSIRPNIDIKGENFFVEIYFNMKWIDRDKKDNMEYIKNFLSEKIIGEETKKHIKKINFGEYINLNEEKYEDFFFEELSLFPNASFNIQSNYFDDNGYWKDLDRFFKLKFIIMDNLDSNDNEKQKEKNKSKYLTDSENKNNNNISSYNVYNNNNNNINNDPNLFINVRSKYKNEKKLEKGTSKEIKNDTEINKEIIKDEIKNSSIADKSKNINNKNDSNEIILDNKNQNEELLDDKDNKININNFNNEDIIDCQEDDKSFKIKRLNKNILSIKELDNFVIDLRKNKISIIDEYLDTFTKKGDSIINKIPPKITFINFTYEKNKEYFGELSNKINTLIVVQRIYRNTPYPFFISPNLNSLIALKLERINILEDNLVNIINNNPLLEIFEIHKNYTGYVFGYNLALALSQLQNLKSVITEFFWYKDYVPNFKTNSLVNRQENEFFKFLTSKSLKYLSLANETNININTLNQNLPNLISLSMEYSNIIDDNVDENKEIENDSILSKNTFNNNNIKTRFSFRNKYKKKRSASLTDINFMIDFNYSEKDRLFHKLRDLNVVKIDNFDEFFKKMAFFNKIENLFVDYFDLKFFNTFVKYGHYLNNLDMLYISPDFSERIKPVDSENMVKNIHCFKKLTFLEIGFYCINEELVNLLYDELTKLPLLQQLEIKVDVSSDENKEILKSKIDQLKTKKYNSEYLTITYTFNDKRFKR